MTDYFTVFGLPRKLGVDGEALQRRFYELSRQHHPDFHQGVDAERQAEVLDQSALVNRASRAAPSVGTLGVQPLLPASATKRSHTSMRPSSIRYGTSA